MQKRRMRNLTNGYKMLLWWAFALENKAELFNWRGIQLGAVWKAKNWKATRKNVFCVTYLVIRNVPSVVSVLDRVAELVFACRQGQHVSTRWDYLQLSKKWYYAVCFSNMWPPCSLRRHRNLISSPGPVHRGALCLEWIHWAPLLRCKCLGPMSSKGEHGCTLLSLCL